MRAIEKDRARRYQSPQELGEEISRHLRNEPVLAGPPSWTYRLKKFTKRNPLLTTIFVASALGLMVVGFFKLREIDLEKKADAAKANAAEQERYAAEQERLLSEEKLLSQLLASPQLQDSDAINDKLAALDNALKKKPLSAKSKADLGLYKFDLLAAMQDFEFANSVLGKVEPVTQKQEAQLQLRRMTIAEDADRRAEVEQNLSELSDHLTQAESLLLQSIQHREPRRKIPLLLEALDADPAQFTSRCQLCVAYCLTGQTAELNRLCEISRSLYTATPFFDIVQGFGAAFAGDANGMKACISQIKERLSSHDSEELQRVMKLILQLAVETRELEHGLPKSLDSVSLFSTFRQVTRIDQSSPTMRHLANQLGLGLSAGGKESSLSVLLPRWGVASGQLAFGMTGGYKSLLGDLEELSPIPGDAWFLYLQSMLDFKSQSWAERIRAQEEILQRPSVFPGLKSEITYVLHLSRRGLFMENKDDAVLLAAAEGVRSWLKLDPHWTSSRLEISTDTALAAGDIRLAESVLASSQGTIAPDDASVLLSRMRIELKRKAYHPALELAEELLNDDQWGEDHRLRKEAEKVRDKAITKIRETIQRRSNDESKSGDSD